jgi:hypothetical protein
LTVHVIASVALVGTSAGTLMSALHAATRAVTQQAHALYDLMQLLVYSLGIPCTLIALATGIVLGLTSTRLVLGEREMQRWMCC